MCNDYIRTAPRRIYMARLKKFYLDLLEPAPQSCKLMLESNVGNRTA